MHASRRLLVGLMILGFASAQLISLAHACASGAPAAPAAALAGTTAVMPADCPLMAEGVPSSSAPCDAHCLPSAEADKGADVSIPALALANPLFVRLVQPKVPTSLHAMPPLARIASPPLSLLFGRFLI